jgi:NAD(P)-dependent dehydrogenase (short-subunit alcohol dehydrogenase family)
VPDDETGDPDENGARALAAVAYLEELIGEPRRIAEMSDDLRRRLMVAAGQLSRPDRYTRKAMRKGLQRRSRDEMKASDRAILDGTGIRALRRLPVFPSLGAVPQLPGPETIDVLGETPAAEARRDEPLRVQEARNCYVCKADFHELHPFYDAMCERCAALNWEKRNQTADLRGRVALVTGGRVKIGAQIALKLLRAGAETIIVTRFPVDAARRLATEPNAEELCARAHVYGCDLRHTPSVEALCASLLRGFTRLDVLINNACQTVRRPSGFYDHMIAAETAPWSSLGRLEQQVLSRWLAVHPDAQAQHALLPAGGAPGLFKSAILSQVPLLAEDLERGTHLYPANRLDQDLQQVDLRDFNSWRMTLAEVPTAELLEVHLVNAVAPFVLNARLKPLLAAVPTRDTHIVNVSAMEGQFYRRFKTEKHPHTNMAKAALNMLTRTAAADYVRDGIHMNAVDTGWVTDEDPATIAARKTHEHGFHPPLDIVDGAARVLDPVFAGYNAGRHVWGLFLKDYAQTPW